MKRYGCAVLPVAVGNHLPEAVLMSFITFKQKDKIQVRKRSSSGTGRPGAVSVGFQFLRTRGRLETKKEMSDDHDGIAALVSES
jgi:hypothetical protein